MGDVISMRRESDLKLLLAQERSAAGISACLTCQTCTICCPVSKVNERFNPLRIIRMILLGLEEEVLTNAFIWLCSSCVSCQEICPQGVRISDFMTFLKNLAAKEGYLPVGVRAQLKTIKENARIYPIDEFDNKKRRKLNLPPLPTSCEVVKELFSD